MINSLGLRISNSKFNLQRLTNRLQSSTSSSEIKIPIRIERGPTDILRAIEKTIKRDTRAPHYKYQDDPFLAPYSVSLKRNYALSLDAGRKAAMWIRDQHAELFQHRIADPIIEKYLPKAKYDNKDDVDEDVLKNVISQGHVDDSLTIYKLLNEETTIETKQSLLELLCFYNNSQPISELLLEENWHKRNEEIPKWKDCAEINKLFDFLKNQDIKIATDAYNTMICGMAKYFNSTKAWELFDETEQKNIPLYLTTYNYLISIIPNMKDLKDNYHNYIVELLMKMKKANVQPDIATFNSALKVAASIRDKSIAQNSCCSIFAEFKHIGIKPSLASYYYILLAFYHKTNRKSDLLNVILDEIDGQEFEIHDNADTNFFGYAMKVASDTLQNPIIGNKIHKLLLTGQNRDFINEAYKESRYYFHYFMLHLRNQPFDEFVKYYNEFVPHLYTPEVSVMDAILDTIFANDPQMCIPLLPKFWSHIVQFDMLERKNLVSKALNLMVTHCKPPVDSPINSKFSDAAWTVWDFVTTQKARRMQKMDWTGIILADIAILLLRAGKMEKFLEIISYFYEQEKSIVGTPHLSQIEELLEGCILNGYSNASVDLVHYCSIVGIENVPNMAIKISENLPLNEWEENRLKSLVSSDVLELKTTKSQSTTN